MRIALYVTPSFPRISQTFTVSKFLGLLANGWDVHVVCPFSKAEDWSLYPELSDIPEIRRRIHVVGLESSGGLLTRLKCIFSLGSLLWNLPATFRYLKRGWECYGVDVLHQINICQDAKLIRLQPDLVHFEFASPAARLIYLRELLGCKATASFRTAEFSYVRIKQKDYYDELWNKADGLHLLGENLWQRAQWRGCPEDIRHVFIPDAIDVSFFDPGDRRHVDVVGTVERPLQILSVGRLVWHKGYEFGLQAVKLLREQGIHCQYNIIGAGNQWEVVQYAKRQLGLDGIVNLLGGRDRLQIRANLSQTDVFLHSSVSEGLGSAVIESQAMKVPVVCSDAGGLPENVADGETGFVVPRRNPQALAEKLALLAKSPQLRQRMGEAGRTRVKKHFQIDDQIAAFEQFYRQVLGS